MSDDVKLGPRFPASEQSLREGLPVFGVKAKPEPHIFVSRRVWCSKGHLWIEGHGPYCKREKAA